MKIEINDEMIDELKKRIIKDFNDECDSNGDYDIFESDYADYIHNIIENYLLDI